MKIEIEPNGVWYHGSNVLFSQLRTNSAITQWKELAEAFSHQPGSLEYNDNGVIGHNGVEKEVEKSNPCVYNEKAAVKRQANHASDEWFKRRLEGMSLVWDTAR